MALNVNRDVSALVGYAVRTGFIQKDDFLWAYNTVLDALDEDGAGGVPRDGIDDHADGPAFDLESTIGRLAEAGVHNGVDEDTPSGRDRIATEVMGRLMPRPSDINVHFEELRAQSPKVATDWFYRLCCDARYVREAAIAKNLSWPAATPWGNLEITINLSKPEKDPAAIARAGKASVGEKYPACQLCVENEGYRGRGAGSAMGAHPARQNLRIVPIELGGERWGFQYSPYAYFREHCIAMSTVHRPMVVNRENMSRLLDFVDLFPHYFIGSNADLPIVGGSILSHDHFQGGNHVFPMMRAEAVQEFSVGGFEDVTAEVLRWPLSVLRLRSAYRERLLDAACKVTEAWRVWSDVSVGVIAESDGERHNTVTPVVRHVGSEYVMYLALRCNITTAKHPLGVFHPHEDKWHIKKENIGLIEVMGMAILPPRLVDELGRVRDALVAGDVERLAEDPKASAHLAWARELAAAYPEVDSSTADAVVRTGVGEVFGHVLEDAGVFKWDASGRAALNRFLTSLAL